MGYKSRMEYPRPRPSIEEVKKRITAYIDRDLTKPEASDLVALELVEEQGRRALSPSGNSKKKGVSGKIKKSRRKINCQNPASRQRRAGARHCMAAH